MAVKILSVDDEQQMESLMRQYFRRKIRSGEYEFLFAYNGREALELLAQRPDIDIILSDINMPEMDGLTLLSKIHEKKNPAQRVVMVSAYDDMRNIREAMNKGAFDFATKPIDMEDLSLTIEKAIAEIEYVRKAQQEHDQLESLKSDVKNKFHPRGTASFEAVVTHEYTHAIDDCLSKKYKDELYSNLYSRDLGIKEITVGPTQIVKSVFPHCNW